MLDVLTEEFLSDIGATTLDQALAFSANFAEDLGDFEAQNLNTATTYPGQLTGANFRTRGLGATLARNYLETDFRPTFYTTERIDNSSGPNSILFGLGSAGGVANISTKQAKLNRAAYGLDFLYDNYGSRRVTTDINQTLIPQTLALRVNALLNRGKRYRENFDDNTTGLHLAGKWRVNDRTEVRVEYELEHTTGSVTHWLSAYANRSSNFGSPRGTVIGPDAIVGPNTQGVGLDAGLKFSLLDNKVALDVGYFDTASTINQLLNTLDDQLDLLIANNSSNFGGGKASINFVGSYDFPGRLKGWGTTLTSIYRSGPYVGVYEVHDGGVVVQVLPSPTDALSFVTARRGSSLRPAAPPRSPHCATTTSSWLIAPLVP